MAEQRMSETLAIRVKNLRSLKDTGFVELRPITILVGRNSAGKSTFARILPLLRQTAEVRKRSPVLWWGRLVDFGSFATSVNRSCEPREIEFGFRVSIDRSDTAFRTSPRVRLQIPNSQIVDATLTMREDASTHESELSRIRIQRGNDVYVIDFSGGDKVTKVTVNSFAWQPPDSYRQEVIFGSIMPSIQFYESRTIKGEKGDVVTYFRSDPLRKQLFRHFFDASLVHGNTSISSISDLCLQLDPEDETQLLAMMQAAGTALPSWTANAKGMTKSSHRFKQLRDHLLANDLDNLIRQVDEAIVSTVSRCAYIEPLRATAERYYRKQGLAVAEVDSKGSNVPFFLDSLTSSERERFDSWMSTHLQAGVKASSDGGHLSIKLKDAGGNETNLADVGFGFSQVLPVALQLWAASQRSSRARVARRSARRRLPPSTVVIEQPELHLHPEYQAKVADLLKSTIDGGNVCLIVETHSPTIVNRLGLLVASGELTRDQVQILRFDKDDSSDETFVALSEFDDNGVLANWPYGFFDA
jgi:hypothetical protein